jgi:hypothetical protein
VGAEGVDEGGFAGALGADYVDVWRWGVHFGAG